MSKGSKYSRNARKTREQNNVILLVCGGETEQIYFKKFNIDLGEIKIKSILENRNPLYIVRTAIAEKVSGNYKMVWCLFDKDDFPDFDEAISLAKRNDIRVAYSNQAFELWFLLHFEFFNGSLHRNKYAAKLEGFLGRTYDKTDANIYKLLKSRTDAAIQNARLGHERHKLNAGNPSSWESCTNVYELVSELLRWKL